MRYTLDSFREIVEGRQPLPHPEQIDDRRALDDIAAFGHSFEDVWGYCRHHDNSMQWTQYFLNISQGEGLAIIYRRGAFRFAICKHEKVPGADANPLRGWHPGHCRLCGLDMTVDSSD